MSVRNLDPPQLEAQMARGDVDLALMTTQAAPSTFRAFFARVGGKLTGFSAQRIVSSGSFVTSHSLGLVMPIAANPASAYVGVASVGLMDRSTFSFLQGSYASTDGLSGSR